MYAIVDIETTGGYAANHRITEVAIYLHDGMHITDRFHTLINPERNIPYYITGLTGITTEMVLEAPSFKEVAQDIFKRLDGKIFVAHNAHFDYSFLKKELSTCGEWLTINLPAKPLPNSFCWMLISPARKLNFISTVRVV